MAEKKLSDGGSKTSNNNLKQFVSFHQRWLSHLSKLHWEWAITLRTEPVLWNAKQISSNDPQDEARVSPACPESSSTANMGGAYVAFSQALNDDLITSKMIIFFKLPAVVTLLVGCSTLDSRTGEYSLTH